jgi:poly-gamma-glutamate synthesis protein (capsule biosynthesis protein)
MSLSRRGLLKLGATLAGGLCLRGARAAMMHPGQVSLFLSGDVMLGRGIDQIMPQSADPGLHEPFLTDARQYIQLAEVVNGPVPRAVDPDYVWGEGLEELNALDPDVRIINLENAVTRRGSPWPGKGIHYRMHPANASILKAADIDCCVLANNHVLDWGYEGLDDTLQTLSAIKVEVAGAGYDAQSAQAPAVIAVGADTRVHVVGLASGSSGVPAAWQAGDRRSGLNRLGGDIDSAVETMVRAMAHKAPGDIGVVSVHWGGNWGYEIPAWQRRLAHALIDTGMVDVVHGHSSHHPKGIEVYRDRLILYGCGDLINDYEGIRGHEAFRSHLRLMYFPVLDASGRLLALTLTPMHMARFRLQRATLDDTRWLLDVLNKEGEALGTQFALDAAKRLVLVAGGSGQGPARSVSG